MKRTFLYIKGTKKWNNLLRKFRNLYKRIRTLMSSNNYTEKEHKRLEGKIKSVYGRLERMQYRAGMKMAAGALVLMLAAAVPANAQMTFAENTTGNPLDGVDVGTYSIPTFEDIDRDGDLDAFIGTFGSVKHYENDGTGTFTGNTADNPLSVATGSYLAPTFEDIDRDGDLDAFIGNDDGSIKYYENDGIGTFTLNAGANTLSSSNIAVTPAFADIDRDGDLDAFIGNNGSIIKYYENDGNGTFTENTTDNPFDGVDVGSYSTPTFADIDRDGDLDAFIGNYDGTIKYYENDGNGTFTENTIDNPFDGVDVGYFSAPTFADIDRDGDLDAFIGNSEGTIKYYENAPTPGLWTGAIDTDWFNTGNWNDGVVPLATTNVTIPDVTNKPNIAATTTAVCKNITIESNSSLTLGTGKLTVSGNWDNQGTLTAGSGAVEFNGTAAQTIGGTNSFYDLTINNTHESEKVDASAATSCNVTNSLNINDGIFKSK